MEDKTANRIAIFHFLPFIAAFFSSM